jgi:hypothetical protein
MGRDRQFFQFIGVVAALLATALWFWLPNRAMGDTRPHREVSAAYDKLPLYFCPNQGQVEQQVKFYTCGRAGAFFFTPEGVVFSLAKPIAAEPAGKEILSQETPEKGRMRKIVVRLKPLGMQPRAEVVAMDPQPGKINYFIGNDPKKWHKNIPTYKAVVYREAYPGIDLKFYGNGHHLEYDLIVKPGADPGQVKFQYQGIKGLELTRNGDLTITLPDGATLTQKKPVAYQKIAGQRVPRVANFKVCQDLVHFTYAFDVGVYDDRYPLIIDPSLEYFTYLGGVTFDWGNGIAVDSTGRYIYVTGQTYSAQYPVFTGNKIFPPGSTPTSAIFVTKLDVTQTDQANLVYSTMLGGNNDNLGAAIAVDGEGYAYVTGGTEASNFPISSGAVQSVYGGGYWDVFVLRLGSDGGLDASTYLGGGDLDGGRGIALQKDGDGKAVSVYVTGKTFSSDFPKVLNAVPLSPYKGNGDGFVAKLDPTLSQLTYSIYLGGKDDDGGNGIAADSDGNAYVTGSTVSSDFRPIVNAFRSKKSGTYDAFVTKLNPSGGVLWSTFLGGKDYDSGEAIAADGSGAYIAGYTHSSNFPVSTGAAQTSKKGGKKTADAFATKLDTITGRPVYSTYLGGSNSDYAYGIAVDSSGNAYVTGGTVSSDFPTTQVLGTTPGGWDVFVTRLNSSGAQDYSIILGGKIYAPTPANEQPGSEGGYAIAVDGSGAAYVTGYSSSNDLGTSGAYQRYLYPGVPNGSPYPDNVNPNPYDAFVGKISPDAD